MVERRRASTALASTSGLVGGDDDGRAFAEWYADGYDSLTATMDLIAERNFSSAAGLRNFEQLWDYLEQKIISQLPDIPDLPSAPIPQAPPPREGA
ncbi:hypothetical protein ABZ897_11450 [Nonomuraea sp. NPDC046802]|uniref:hypothetical protein n=1 Tax=Nonomuraea sp. NPDC046802 TaxID=3154919 RepID=UPI0033E039CD